MSHQLPHFAENIGHFLTLLLGPLMSAQLSLSHFQCTLVFPNFEQFSDSLFIGSKTSNFPDETSHKMDSFTRFLYKMRKYKFESTTISYNRLNSGIIYGRYHIQVKNNAN